MHRYNSILKLVLMVKREVSLFIPIFLQSSLKDVIDLFKAYGMKVSAWSEVPKALKMLKESNEALQEKAMMEKDEALKGKDKALKEKDEALKGKDKALKEKEKAMKAMDEAMREKDQILIKKDEIIKQISKVEVSHTWYCLFSVCACMVESHHCKILYNVCQLP